MRTLFLNPTFLCGCKPPCVPPRPLITWRRRSQSDPLVRRQGLSSQWLFESLVRHMGIIAAGPGMKGVTCKSSAEFELGNIVPGVFTPFLEKSQNAEPSRVAQRAISTKTARPYKSIEFHRVHASGVSRTRRRLPGELLSNQIPTTRPSRFARP